MVTKVMVRCSPVPTLLGFPAAGPVEAWNRRPFFGMRWENRILETRERLQAAGCTPRNRSAFLQMALPPLLRTGDENVRVAVELLASANHVQGR